MPPAKGPRFHNHAAKILHPKVLKSIMRDAEISPEDLEKLL
jgi:hypothetical protein